jgi:hypothetical protein
VITVQLTNTTRPTRTRRQQLPLGDHPGKHISSEWVDKPRRTIGLEEFCTYNGEEEPFQCELQQLGEMRIRIGCYDLSLNPSESVADG